MRDAAQLKDQYKRGISWLSSSNIIYMTLDISSKVGIV